MTGVPSPKLAFSASSMVLKLTRALLLAWLFLMFTMLPNLREKFNSGGDITF